MMNATAIWKSFFILLVLGVLVLSGLYYGQYGEMKGIEKKLEEISLKYKQLTELVDLCMPPTTYPFPYGVVIRSGCRLQFYRSGGDKFSFNGPVAAVFYNWLENSTLELDLTIQYPKPGLYAQLTLQFGNAFLMESATVCEKMDGYSWCHAPILWEENATATGRYTVLLPDKGWYTISLSGEIRIQLPGGGISHPLIGTQYVNGTWSLMEGVYVWSNFRIIHEDKYIPFALNEDFVR